MEYSASAWLPRETGIVLHQTRDSKEQIKFWMAFFIYLEGDEDGDLRSVVATDAVLSVLEGNLTVQ